MKVTGETIIFRNDHDSPNGKWYSYTTTVSNKRQDGSYARMYLDVRFRKGVVVENKSRINIKDGFLTVREYTYNGETKSKMELMVLDYDTVAGDFTPEQTGFTALSYDETPF